MSDLTRDALAAALGPHPQDPDLRRARAAAILATPAGQALAEVVASAEALESAWDHDNLRAWTGAMRTLLSALDKLREAAR